MSQAVNLAFEEHKQLIQSLTFAGTPLREVVKDIQAVYLALSFIVHFLNYLTIDGINMFMSSLRIH